MPPRQRQLPTTHGFVHARLEKTEARIEAAEARLESAIRTTELNLLQQMRPEMSELESRLKQQIYGNSKRLEVQMEQMEERISKRFDIQDSKMDQRFAEIGEKLSQILVLVEEQSTRTRIALEHTTGLAQAQARLEGRMDACEDWVRALSGRRESLLKKLELTQ